MHAIVKGLGLPWLCYFGKHSHPARLVENAGPDRSPFAPQWRHLSRLAAKCLAYGEWKKNKNTCRPAIVLRNPSAERDWEPIAASGVVETPAVARR